MGFYILGVTKCAGHYNHAATTHIQRPSVNNFGGMGSRNGVLSPSLFLFALHRFVSIRGFKEEMDYAPTPKWRWY